MFIGTSDIYSSLRKKLQEKVLALAEHELLDQNTDELVKSLLIELQLKGIEYDMNKAQIKQRTEIKTVPENQRDSFSRFQGDLKCEYVSLDYLLPYSSPISSYDLKKILPNTYSMSWTPNELEISENEILTSAYVKGYGFDYTKDDQKTKAEIEGKIKHLKNWLERLNVDIKEGDSKLEQEARELIEARHKKVKERGEDLAKTIEQIDLNP